MANGNTATSLGRSTFTQGILLWLQRNDAVDASKSTPADGWRNYLQRQTGGTGTDGKRDLERTWLMQRIATLGGSHRGQCSLQDRGGRKRNARLQRHADRRGKEQPDRL